MGIAKAVSAVLLAGCKDPDLRVRKNYMAPVARVGAVPAPLARVQGSDGST